MCKSKESSVIEWSLFRCNKESESIQLNLENYKQYTDKEERLGLLVA